VQQRCCVGSAPQKLSFVVARKRHWLGSQTSVENSPGRRTIKLPDHNQGCENRLMFAWKQGSKGLAFIASPYPMVWTVHLQCIVDPESKVINARKGVWMSEGTDV